MAAVMDAVARHARPGASILDVGCGDGHIMSLLSGAGLRAIGMDVCSEAISCASRKHPDQVFINGSVERLPFPSATFDLVYAGSVLQYTERMLSLREIARVLKPGGLFISVENLHGSPLARLARTYFKLSRHKYPAFGTPRQHLRREHLLTYFAVFASVRSSCFNLFAPVLWAGALALRARRFLRRTAEPSLLFSAVHDADRRLMNAFPILERFAWHIVICAQH
jgi:ubiquinone/menaquinone biosynthesis C-methylase UbiE